MKNTMNLKTKKITMNNMWIDLERMLDEIDADFTGFNGEDYYIDGMSHMDKAIIECEHLEGEQDKIEYVLDSCKEYSSDYYEDFEYVIITVEDGYNVVIATMG